MGIREIFFPAPRAVILPAECLAITLRLENDYFIGKSDEDLEEMKRTKNLPEWVLPRFPLTDQHVKEHLKKNEILRNRELAWVYRCTQEFSVEFRQRLASGTIKSIRGKDRSLHPLQAQPLCLRHHPLDAVLLPGWRNPPGQQEERGRRRRAPV